MSKSTPLSKEETKERIRAALDILGRFTDADGKLNATKMSRRIRELEAGSDVCGDEALHCETARRLRERVRELEAEGCGLREAIEMHAQWMHAGAVGGGHDAERCGAIEASLWKVLEPANGQ